MVAEDHHGKRGPLDNPAKVNHSLDEGIRFDELARGLANGTITRRRALKLGIAALTSVVGTAAFTSGLPARFAATAGCRGEGHPCEGTQKCCPGLTCVEGGGHGNHGKAARCVGVMDPSAMVHEEMGAKAGSYFDNQINDPTVIDYINQRANSFGSACNLGGAPDGLKLTLLTGGSLPILDIGGQFTNDQSFVANIDLEASSAFAQYFSGETGHEVQNDNVHAFFVTNRFFDAKASNVNGQPLVGIADAVVVFVTDVLESKKQTTIELYKVDCSGVHLLRKITASNNTTPPTNPIEENPSITARDARVNAYFGSLVADYTTYVEENGELHQVTKKVLVPYDPFDFEDPLPSDARRRTSFAGIEGVQYQRFDPNVPPEEYGEPSESNDTGGEPTQIGTWNNLGGGELFTGLQVQGYALEGPEISTPWPPPSAPPGMGYGPPSIGGGVYRCWEWEQLDNCKTCCSDAGLGAQAGVLAMLAICLTTISAGICWVVPFIGNVSCAAACGVTAAAMSVTFMLMTASCDNNCYLPTPLPGRS